MSNYPANVAIEYPENLSRGWVVLKGLFGWIYAGIPHGIILSFYGIAVTAVTFIAFWIILFTGKYPKGLYDFVVGYIRWSTRLTVYLSLMRDEYPPFTTEE
ncbi:DUF4389 domain-containing protein [Chloroflexota bacterium]